MQPETRADLAAMLALNRLAGIASPLPLTGVHNRADADIVQMDAMEIYGPDVKGYALAGTNPAARPLLGVSGPIYGLIASRALGNGSGPFRLPQGSIGAQCELVFTIGRSYPDPDERIDRQSAAGIIVACRPAIGLLGRRTQGLPLTDTVAIADFGLHVATICGTAMRTDWLTLDAMAVTARLDGTTVMTGTGKALMGHPLDALAWLARTLARQGKQINAGEIVATGSCTPILQVLPGQTLDLHFDPIGDISATFE